LNRKHIGLILLLLVMIFTYPTASIAMESADAQTGHQNDYTGLSERIIKLEKAMNTSPDYSKWFDRITISGLLEAEAGYERMDYDDPGLKNENTSDAVLATMELGIDADIAEHVTGHALFLWEEDDTEPIDLDEGFISISGGDVTFLYLSAGKMYVPFGNFESTMISDPLTLELGETRESAIVVGCEREGFYGSVYVFNGDIDEDGEDSQIDNFGANAGFTMENDDFSLDVGVCYINNLLDSDGLGDSVAETMDADGTALSEYVDGFGAHAIVNAGPFMLIGEYITALDEPEFVSDVPGAGTKSEEISAYNAEVAFTFDMAGKETTVGIAYQGTDDAGDFLPESRVMGAIGVGIFENTSLALEYLHDEFENDDEVDTVTAQLSIEF